MAVLPELARRHTVLCLAGSDAYAAIVPDFPAIRIPTMGFSYAHGAPRLSLWRTISHNLPAALDLLCRGPVFALMRDIVRQFEPDVIISDAEAWSHRVAEDLKIPRISFDHIGLMAYCRPQVEWRDRAMASLTAGIYGWLMGRPERVILASFYPVPACCPKVKVVGPVIRPAVRKLSPRRGDHVLAYFNKGHNQLRPKVLEALASLGRPVHVYGSDRRGVEGPLTFLPLSSAPFLDDLAGCRAVISTAGNQLMSEALYLGKPVCVVPEDCVEQRLNAAAVQRLGMGIRLTLRTFTAQRLREFLDSLDSYADPIGNHVRDGGPQALAAIEEFLTELAPVIDRGVRPLSV